MTQDTHFAPAERDPQDLVEAQAQLVCDQPNLAALYESVTDLVFVLNPQRQIVFANRNAQRMLGLESVRDCLGQRLGEVLHCAHSHTEAGGCGTSVFCRTCGAANAILTAQGDKVDVQECRILQAGLNQALDLMVKTTPLELGGTRFTTVAVTDISDEKRRKALERIFFHDIMNTASAVHTLAQLMDPMQDEAEFQEFREMLVRSSGGLIEEIQAQRDLSAAESGELTIKYNKILCREFLTDLVSLFEKQDIAANCTLRLQEVPADVAFISDTTLLRRIVGNLVKNALEACLPQREVTISCLPSANAIRFAVHNSSYMPEDVQTQVFQRSFSTKGPGRGLGTYSVKLLAERYLHGQVGFESNRLKGTTFWVEFPHEPAAS